MSFIDKKIPANRGWTGKCSEFLRPVEEAGPFGERGAVKGEICVGNFADDRKHNFVRANEFDDTIEHIAWHIVTHRDLLAGHDRHNGK